MARGKCPVCQVNKPLRDCDCGKQMCKSCLENHHTHAEEDVKINVTGSQHLREPGAPTPACPPTEWESIMEMDGKALEELGCRPFDEPDDHGLVLYLFPGEWYAHIPVGFQVTSISGRTEGFLRAPGRDDIRYGCLAFGLKR